MEYRKKLDDFFLELGRNGKGLLLLDYDGTLAPFNAKRMEAFPAEGIVPRLNAILKTTTTRIAFVSGRQTHEIAELARLERPIAIWGCHGREFRDLDGAVRLYGVTPLQQAVLKAEHELVLGHLPEPAVELKTGCLAFHWRGVGEEERSRLLERLEPHWQSTALEHGLNLDRFDGGIEISVPGRTKGDGVEHLVRLYADDETSIAFLGDDLTDEDGFKALAGRGLSVLVRNEPRPTAADVRVPFPNGVVDFLDRWLESIREGSPNESSTVDRFKSSSHRGPQ